MKWVRRLARAMVRDADKAEDLAQDAWQLALEQPVRQGNAWRGWFSRVMKNRVVDQWYSKERRKPLNAQLPTPDDSVTPEETLQRLETQQALGEAVKGLDEPYRSALLLHYFEGWSVRQIAIHEGVQPRAIETRLRRARDQIRLKLEKRGSIQTWAKGLLLLALPLPMPALIRPAVGVGLVIAAVGLLGWLIWPDPALQQETGSLAKTLVTTAETEQSDFSNFESITVPQIQRGLVAVTPVSLRFSVIDAGTEKPLAGVRVHGEFLDADGKSLRGVEWISDPGTLFESPNPVGARQVRLVTEMSESHAGVPAGGLYSWEDQSVNPVIEIRSERLQGEILGRVLDPAGNPVPGAEVGVWLKNQERQGREPDRRIPVADDGSFTIPLARADTAALFLAPLAPGHSAQRSYRLGKDRPANAYVEDLELILVPGRELMVRVADEAGEPISGAEVVIWPSQPADAIPVFPLGHYEGRLQHHLRTNAAGQAPPLRLGAEAYSLSVRCDGYAQQSRELAADETNVTLLLPPALLVMGQVRTPQGDPVPGVKVIVEGVGEEECQTDGEGRFRAPCPSQPGEEVRLILIPPAPHALQVWGPFQPQELSEPIVCQLEPSQRISARLLGADGELYLVDPDLRVEISGGPKSRQPNGDEQLAESWAQFLPTPRRNAFKPKPAAELQLDGLPAGTYRVSFHGRSGLLAQGLVEAGAERADILIGSYPEARAALSGRVRPPNGSAPIRNFRIHGQRLESADPGSLLPEQVGLDCESEHGSFEMRGIPPGWWQLQVIDLDSDRAWGLAAVHLEAGRSLVLEPFLDETFEGRLTVSLPDGTPAAGLRLRLLDYNGQALIFGIPPRFQDQLDSQGSFFLQGLPRSTPPQVELRARDGRTWRLPASCLTPELGAWEHRLSPD
jgi:RNA polymerase sigma-70 factor (ECF subfamily)